MQPRDLPSALLKDASSERAAEEGPLRGLRLAVKDCFELRGARTGFGQPTFLAQSKEAKADAALVAAHLAQGCQLVGKAQMVEMAFALTGRNSHYGTPMNAKHPDRLPGGSSSGCAAAVGALEADLGLGTDTFGSIRVPASYCGLFGWRPSHGRANSEGVIPLAPSLDTPGWLSREMAPLQRVENALFSAHPAPEITPEWPARVPTVLLNRLDGSCREAFESLMNRLPDFLSLIDLPLDVARWVSALRIIQGFEAWQAHGPFIETHQPQLGPGIRERFRFAASVSHSDYRRALEERRLCGQEFEAAIDPASLLCFPTAPGPAPSLEEPEAALEAHRTVLLQLMALSSLRGSPEISLPLLTVKGLSVGVSLVAPRHTDRILLQRARELTQRALAAH